MIKLDNVSKIFGTGLAALEDVTFEIVQGEFVFFVGPSGSGKTTLLRMLIRDVLPTKGTIFINELDIVKMPSGKIPHLRRKIGVVFQDLKLLSDRTIFENIMLPLEMSKVEKNEAAKLVDSILSQVGIGEQRDKFPVQLSGGELQRAAIARALIFSPEILLADEPTGNLDAATSWEIVKLLQDINASGTTVIMATHNTEVVDSLLKRIITLDKGRVVKDEREKVKTHEKHEKAEKEEKEKEKPSSASSSAKDTDDKKAQEDKKEEKEK